MEIVPLIHAMEIVPLIHNDELLLHVELIDVSDESQLWGEQFKEHQPCPTILIFDRDKQDVVAKVENPSKGFEDWEIMYSLSRFRHLLTARGCMAFVLSPITPTRNFEQRINSAAVCSFLLNLPSSGRHVSNPNLSVGNKGKPQRSARHLPTDRFGGLRRTKSERRAFEVWFRRARLSGS